MSFPSDQPNSDSLPRRVWFWRGVRASFSIPGLILCSAFIGFAGLAKAAGLTLGQTVFMVGVVWALPAKVVLIGAIVSGSSVLAAAFAVALSSIRLMPMVVALVPELRGPKTARWVPYVLSHFVAVTSWVLAMDQLRHLPRHVRTTYYPCLGGTLVLANMILTGVVFLLADSFPPIVMAGLLLLTPIYFLTSLWGSARERAAHVAMVFGLVLGPLVHLVAPGFDLLIAGLVGGIGAYFIHRYAASSAA